MSQDVVVLGGGVAGLAAARELLKRGCSVTLIEKGNEVGGLARTFERDGFRFDIGGHRFHSNNPSVIQWLKDLLKSDLLVVPRISHIYLNSHFVDYPIQFPGALSIFSLAKAVQMVGSYLMVQIVDKNRKDTSFEDWVVKRYGRALYEVFFEPYTEKVWGIPCKELSAEWASQRIGIPSMRRMVEHALFPPKETLATAVSEFYYPRTGFGMIPRALARDIIIMGGLIYTGTSLTSCVPQGDGFLMTVTHKDNTVEELKADTVVSTIPLNYLLQAIPAELGSRAVLDNYTLDYRDIICLFIALKKDRVSEDSWTYFPGKHLIFGRTHEPKNWSPEMVPDDSYTSLGVEIFSSRGEEIWSMPDEAILDKVVSQMDEIGWINKSHVHNSWVLRVPYAYPVYRIGYKEKLACVKEYLSQWKNLYLVGRTGSFRYMNSDGVVEDVFRLIEELFPAGETEVKTLAVGEGRWV